MRNLLSKSFAILFVASALMFTSCSKDNDGPGSVAGEWTANSFTADGVEMLGTFFTSVTMNIGEMNNNSGSWNMTANILGLGADTAIGTYVMDGDKMNVVVDGETTVFDYTLSGSSLEIRGTDPDDGVYYVVKSTRK